jgi:hypothetical protein
MQEPKMLLQSTPRVTPWLRIKRGIVGLILSSWIWCVLVAIFCELLLTIVFGNHEVRMKLITKANWGVLVLMGELGTILGSLFGGTVAPVFQGSTTSQMPTIRSSFWGALFGAVHAGIGAVLFGVMIYGDRDSTLIRPLIWSIVAGGVFGIGAGCYVGRYFTDRVAKSID